jgi:hypothetical protein
VAESSDKKSNELPLPAITSIVFALAAVLTNHFNPLDSPRPTIPNSKSLQYVNIEDIEARLWQDPFTAISQHKHDADAPKDDCPSDKQTVKTDKKIKDTTKCKHNLSALTGSIVGKSNSNNPQITILGVMVPGSSSTEDIEDRRRTRYAVLSGLAVKEYAPVDREHIGYIEKLGLEDKKLTYMPEKIPFEWFKTDKDKQQSVLILWLDDSAFGSMPQPLQMTSDFVEVITTVTKNQFNGELKPTNTRAKKTPALTFRFIGPASSNTLQVMLDELATKSSDLSITQDKIPTYPFKLYNAAATGDWPGINIPHIQDDADKKTIETYHNSLGLENLFTRTSLTDYDLAEALAKELELRGFKINKDKSDPKDHKDHIVIISEWDTVFGRLGLPKNLKNQFAPMKNQCEDQEILENKCNWQEVDWIHSFSYMRGLDGVIPGSEKTTEETKNNKDKDQTNNAEINLERSEGQSQQDYLRRLAAHIDEIKQQLENENKGAIKAIGVLGSDAYDKLMILKALRPSFPNAVFFTTDLDTRLLHPKEFDVTRNLIVAASFNLQLAEKLQKTIPPFRDSYQTAHFFATQIAVDNANGIKLSQAQINVMLGDPRLFETGNNKAIALNYLKKENEKESKDRSLNLRNILNVFTTNLSSATGLAKDRELCTDLQQCKNAHLPPIPKNSTHILWALGIIIFSWIILVAYIWSEKFKNYLLMLRTRLPKSVLFWNGKRKIRVIHRLSDL